MKLRKRSLDDGLDLLADLLEKVGRADTAAFEQLHLLSRNKLRKTILSVCRTYCDIDDILQEAYLRIWRSAALFDRAVASPMTWLCTIARNLAIDSVRLRRLPWADLEEAMSIPAPSEDGDDFDYALAKRITTEAMNGLPEDRQRLLKLAYFEGMSRQSLAHQFGVPVGTIKTWLRRALISIQSEFPARNSIASSLPV